MAYRNDDSTVPSAVTPLVDVYIATLPEHRPIGKVLCAERMNEILSASNGMVKRERYFVWKLLCHALKNSFGIDETDARFVKESTGRWTLDGIYLSISHSKGALAVAVSGSPVGIDIELLGERKNSRFPERILAEEEHKEYKKLPPEKKDSFILSVWTAKEAIFKSKGKSAFIPSSIDTLRENHRTGFIKIADCEYVWSVATDDRDALRVFTDIYLD